MSAKHDPASLAAQREATSLHPAPAVLPEMLEAYLLVLLEDEPATVLDVGCGAGRVVETLRAKGIGAIGIEVAPPQAARLLGGVLSADATHLPFIDDSFDWGSFRHVPHHLPDPTRAFAEAWRVCRHGLVIAEPYFDASIPSQQVAAKLDSWLKERDRRRGMHHAEVLSAADLMAHLPTGVDCRVQTLVPLRPYPPAKLERDLAAAIGDTHLSAEEEREFDSFRKAARTGGLTANGTLLLRAEKV